MPVTGAVIAVTPTSESTSVNTRTLSIIQKNDQSPVHKNWILTVANPAAEAEISMDCASGSEVAELIE